MAGHGVRPKKEPPIISKATLRKIKEGMVGNTPRDLEKAWRRILDEARSEEIKITPKEERAMPDGQAMQEMSLEEVLAASGMPDSHLAMKEYRELIDPKTREIRIVFKPNPDNPNLLFTEIEDEHGCSMVEPGKWREREDGFRELVLRVVEKG